MCSRKHFYNAKKRQEYHPCSLLARDDFSETRRWGSFSLARCGKHVNKFRELQPVVPHQMSRFLPASPWLASEMAEPSPVPGSGSLFSLGLWLQHRVRINYKRSISIVQGGFHRGLSAGIHLTLWSRKCSDHIELTCLTRAKASQGYI